MIPVPSLTGSQSIIQRGVITLTVISLLTRQVWVILDLQTSLQGMSVISQGQWPPQARDQPDAAGPKQGVGKGQATQTEADHRHLDDGTLLTHLYKHLGGIPETPLQHHSLM